MVEVFPVPGGPYSSMCGSLFSSINLSTIYVQVEMSIIR